MINFDQTIEVIGADYVALRVIESTKNLKSGGIVLSDSARGNDKLGFYKVEAVGSNAEKEYGLKIGDYVLADALAVFYKSSPVCFMKYVNVIVKTNADRTEYKPLKNMVFVKKDKHEVKNLGGIYIQNETAMLQTGIITEKNIEPDIPFPFNIGDKVLLTKGADIVDLNQDQIFIYKPDMLICKLED